MSVYSTDSRNRRKCSRGANNSVGAKPGARVSTTIGAGVTPGAETWWLQNNQATKTTEKGGRGLEGRRYSLPCFD